MLLVVTVIVFLKVVNEAPVRIFLPRHQRLGNSFQFTIKFLALPSDRSRLQLCPGSSFLLLFL